MGPKQRVGCKITNNSIKKITTTDILDNIEIFYGIDLSQVDDNNYVNASDYGYLPFSYDILSEDESVIGGADESPSSASLIIENKSQDSDEDESVIGGAHESQSPASFIIDYNGQDSDEMLSNNLLEPIVQAVPESYMPDIISVESEEVSHSRKESVADIISSKSLCKLVKAQRTSSEDALVILKNSGLTKSDVEKYIMFYYEYNETDRDKSKEITVLERAFSCGIKLTEKANCRIFNIGSNKYRSIVKNLSSASDLRRKEHHFQNGVKHKLDLKCLEIYKSFMTKQPLRNDNYFVDENIVSIKVLYELYRSHCFNHEVTYWIISYASFLRLRKQFYPHFVFHGRYKCWRKNQS